LTKPHFNKIIVQGLFINMTFTRNKKGSIEQYLEKVKEYTQDTLVWRKCGKCGREVPAIDWTIKDCCYFCLESEEEYVL